MGQGRDGGHYYVHKWRLQQSDTRFKASKIFKINSPLIHGNGGVERQQWSPARAKERRDGKVVVLPLPLLHLSVP